MWEMGWSLLLCGVRASLGLRRLGRSLKVNARIDESYCLSLDIKDDDNAITCCIIILVETFPRVRAALDHQHSVLDDPAARTAEGLQSWVSMMMIVIIMAIH